jgi:hypothetical protein
MKQQDRNDGPRDWPYVVILLLVAVMVVLLLWYLLNWSNAARFG